MIQLLVSDPKVCFLTRCVPFADGLQQAYAGSVPFQRDGLYLLHKEGYYSLDTSPLALLWKDGSCSQYFIDTDAQGVTTEQQVGRLS